MKKLLCTSVAGLLIGNALPAFAASTTDLTVQGLIVPSACVPSLSKNAIDLGRISVADLNQDTRTQLASTTLLLNVDCEAATLFAMKTTDNRVDSATGVVEYGIGKTASDQRIGGYAMFLDKGVADLAPVRLIMSLNNGSVWSTQWPDDGWQTDTIISISDPGAARTPIPAKNTQMELTVNPFIHAKNSVTITEDTTIDGSVTIDVKYL
ncbi:DUF1120 domain-containing protein [Pseudomonas reactans]